MSVAQYLTLNNEIILHSKEIQNWLNQFEKEDQPVIISFLQELTFITMTSFNKIATQELKSITKNSNDNESDILYKYSKCCKHNRNNKYGIYSIRNLDSKIDSIWQKDGSVIPRPPGKEGSENITANIINNLCKNRKARHLFDSPSIGEIKQNKINNIILFDDNINSGDKAKNFIKCFFNNKMIRSLYSLHRFELTLFSISMHSSAKNNILNNFRSIKGFKKRLRFHYIFQPENNFYRKEEIMSILDKLRSKIKIANNFKCGYNNIVTTVIFEHSVSNNTLWILYYKNKEWNPLFPERRIPPSLMSHIKKQSLPISENPISKLHIEILKLVRRRYRNAKSIAIQLGYGPDYIDMILKELADLGLIKDRRVSEEGLKLLKKKEDAQASIQSNSLDFSSDILYIPRKWREK